MAKYFLIESRSPFDSTQVSQNYQLASDLANAGNETTLFLVENGVLAARAAAVYGLANLNAVNVLADDFSLRERSISETELKDGVQVASIGAVIEAMAQGQKTIWL
ncbi:MAG: DsrE family protein [Symploca sp. SIO1B1]|nr:DsrE family protein [Symploca sp. SIO1C2]NER48290.1 DsrE family protein [Symploca sp. SIO1A3]NER93363.1 DsrE family protein [Symploca sp. SIO1B1]